MIYTVNFFLYQTSPNTEHCVNQISYVSWWHQIVTSHFMTSFLLLPHKFFKGTHRNPKAVLAKSRSVVICLCFRILFGRSFRNQIDSLGKQTLQTLSLSEWMMEFVRWFLLLHLWTKSCGATIQMKSLWKYFHVVLFVFKNFTK